MKKLYTFIIFICAYPITAQTNLVPNGGFEEYISCPNNFIGNASVYLAEPWIGFSTDYTHTCSGYDPIYEALDAYSSPRNGEGYIRGASYSTANYNTREYAEVQLTETLEVGELYCVEYFCKLQAPNDLGPTGVDGMGAFFTENFADGDEFIYYDWPDGAPVPTVEIIADAQVISELIHDDTLNYTSISGNFIADKAYNYVTIGNFINDNKLNINNVLEGPPLTVDAAIYAIDDVAVWKCNDVSISEEELLPKLYPISNGFVLKRIQEPLAIAIYDMSGRKVHQENVANEGTYKLSFLPAGLYVYRLSDGNTILETGKLFCV